MEILQRKTQQEIFNELGMALPTESTVDETRDTMRSNGINSLYFFTTAILEWKKLRKEPHLEMCNFIQRVPPTWPGYRRRKVLLVPRDTFKSTVGSKSFPLWILIQPDFCGLPGLEHRILLWSHSAENAKKQIKSIRQQLERNTILKWLYPEIVPDITRTTWTDSNLLFPRQGTYGEDTIEAAGIDTHLVSRHYTIQIKDDLEDKASYESPTVRERVKESYKAAEALFVEEQTAYDLLIGTRWGHDDVYEDIQRNESEAYERMVRPLHWTREELLEDINDAKRAGTYPVWNMDPEVYAPEPRKTYYFFPDFFPEDSCRRIKAKQGTFMYSMLYLNNPKNPELAEFREADLRYFTFNDEMTALILNHDDGSKEMVPFDGLKRVMFWDPALSETDAKRNCQNAMVVAFKDKRGRIYIAEAFGDYKNPTMLFSRFIGYHQRYALHQAAIEDVGFQRVLKFPLFHEMQLTKYTFPVTEQRPIAAKEVRIRSMIPYVENHMIWVREGLRDFVDQLKSFPLNPLRDLIDAAAATLPLFGLAQSEGKQHYVQRRGYGMQDSRMASRSAVTGY